jgi:hypothetical protein
MSALAAARATHTLRRRSQHASGTQDLATQLTDLERAYIERRLSEERAAMAALSEETFPFTLPPAAAAAAAKEGYHV